jgi:magnesium transporter
MGGAHTRVYRKGILEAEDFPVADVSEHLEEADTIVWIDFCGPTVEQLHEVAAELGLHELAVEDALGPHQRPKLDHYDSHLFLSCHAVRVNPDEGFQMEPVLARWDRSPHLAGEGVSFLLYGLLDVVIDGYFETVQGFDDFYDVISEGIFTDKPLDPGQQRNWFEMRRALVRFHRLVVPMREAVSALMRREHSVVSDDLYPYYQDVYDHILRVSESTDSLRDLVATIVETNLSLRDYRQNLIMKKVTSWAAIIAVPTLITGFYGMNVPYPGNNETWGVLASLVLVSLCSTSLYLTFKRRDWL